MLLTRINIIAIIITLVLFTFFEGIRRLLRTTLFYKRFEVRNSEVKELAESFGLQFENTSPSLSHLYFSFFRDIKLNHIFGLINNHSVDIVDVYHGIGTWRDGAQTHITIDNQLVKGSISNFTIGARWILTSIPEIRNQLESLK